MTSSGVGAFIGIRRDDIVRGWGISRLLRDDIVRGWGVSRLLRDNRPFAEPLDDREDYWSKSMVTLSEIGWAWQVSM
jgi:hypothetical protein